VPGPPTLGHMPSIVKLARLMTLPETRSLVRSAATSGAVRDIARRARTDRAGLLRDARDPRLAARLMREAVGHPSTRELASVGLLLLPERYMPMGWVATWLTRRMLRRRHDRAAAAQGSPHPAAAWPLQRGR
jgi:hypothetical protein